MSTMTSTCVGSTKHNFYEVPVTNRLKHQHYPKPEVFVPKKNGGTLPFYKMVSTSSTTPHYSPGPENWSVSTADLAVLRVANQQDNFDILTTVWLGTFVRAAHHIVFKHRGANAQWYFAVTHFKDSAVLMWPARYDRVQANGNYYHCWQPLQREEGPVLKPVHDITEYEVFCFVSSEYAIQLVNSISECVSNVFNN